MATIFLYLKKGDSMQTIQNNKQQEIKKWMCSQDLDSYFDGVVDSDFANYTQLGEDASAHFDFHNGSLDDELCFELSQSILDKFITRYANA